MWQIQINYITLIELLPLSNWSIIKIYYWFKIIIFYYYLKRLLINCYVCYVLLCGNHAVLKRCCTWSQNTFNIQFTVAFFFFFALICLFSDRLQNGMFDDEAMLTNFMVGSKQLYKIKLIIHSKPDTCSSYLPGFLCSLV